MNKKRSINPSDAMPGVVGSNDIDLPIRMGMASMSTTAGDQKIDMGGPNDGDNPKIADAPFANGSDLRNKQGGPSSPPNVGKAGA